MSSLTDTTIVNSPTLSQNLVPIIAIHDRSAEWNSAPGSVDRARLHCGLDEHPNDYRYFCPRSTFRPEPTMPQA